MEKSQDLSRKEIEEVVEQQIDPTLKASEIQEVVNEKIDTPPIKRIAIKSINKNIANYLKGFAVIKEEKTGNVHLYYQNPEEYELIGEKELTTDQLSAKSGYYVNYQEYLDELFQLIEKENPWGEVVSFVDQEENEKSIDEVLEEAFTYLRDYGAFYYGNVITRQANTYQELKEINPMITRSYCFRPLLTGLYVRRDLLIEFFKKYKTKIAEKEYKAK